MTGQTASISLNKRGMKTAETILELLSSKHSVTKVKDWLQKNKHQGRSALAQYLCGALNITDHLGKPRIAGVHVALRKLESRGLWKLPKLQRGHRAQQHFRRLNTAVPAPKGVPAQVEQVKGLRLVEVSAGEDRTFSHLERADVDRAPLARLPLGGAAIALSDRLGPRVVRRRWFWFVRFASARA